MIYISYTYNLHQLTFLMLNCISYSCMPCSHLTHLQTIKNHTFFKIIKLIIDQQIVLGHSTGLAIMIKTLQTNYGFLRQKQIMTYSCLHDRFIMFSLHSCQSDFYNLKWILHLGSNSWEIINLQLSKLTPSCVFWCRF